jgi:hypothetical protein
MDASLDFSVYTNSTTNPNPNDTNAGLNPPTIPDLYTSLHFNAYADSITKPNLNDLNAGPNLSISLYFNAYAEAGGREHTRLADLYRRRRPEDEGDLLPSSDNQINSAALGDIDDGPSSESLRSDNVTRTGTCKFLTSCNYGWTIMITLLRRKQYRLYPRRLGYRC